MSDLRINNITDRTGDSGPVIAGVSTVTGTGAFTVPVGPTEMRGGRGRAVFAGGYESPSHDYSDTIEMVEIASTGNAVDFGNLRRAVSPGSGAASATRILFAAGHTPSSYVGIDYITISSGGGASDFGDISVTRRDGSNGLADSTRGVFGGGADASPGTGTNFIEYVTIASTGDASDFGDLFFKSRGAQGCSSPVRGVWAGTYNKPASYTNIVQYVTIQTRGDAKDFGDLTTAQGYYGMGGATSSTRAVYGGGSYYGHPVYVFSNIIQYLTFATTGNMTDFGDMTSNIGFQGAGSNKTRGIFHGGRTPSSVSVNTIQYITIASTGNATDFGDTTIAVYNRHGSSDSHGGLG